MKAFNDLADFSNTQITALLDLADRLDKRPEPEALRGKVLSLLFLSPSLRTLASFQAAIGIIMFGWTTAIIVAIVQRIVQLVHGSSATAG